MSEPIYGDSEELVQHVTRVVVDDEFIQEAAHNHAVRTLQLPSDFGGKDEDEEHPLYDEYWDKYTAFTQGILEVVSKRLKG